MIDEEVNTELDVLRNTTQVAIVQRNEGLFHQSDGDDLDIGICKSNGALYLSVKVDGKWHFTEVKLGRAL
jgi:hypothetical protein